MPHSATDRLPDYNADPPDDEPRISTRLLSIQEEREKKAIAYLKHLRCADGKKLLELAESLYMGVPHDTSAVEDMETIWGIARKWWGK